MTSLRLSFLGDPVVSVNGAAIQLKPRKVLALLSYLAVTLSPHSRDVLAELLFPNLDRNRARAGVRQCLSSLRSAVGKERVRANDESIWLDAAEDLWIDVHEVSKAMGRPSGADAEGETSPERLEKLESLFRGSFLGGFFLKDAEGFESWHRSQEESLRADHIAILARLTDLHLAARALDKALGCAKQWLDIDPMDEAGHRALMKCLALLGRRSEALRQYERLRNLLAAEVGAAPDEDTEALRARIARGDVQRVEGAKPQPAPGALPVHLRSPPTAFLGREPEVREVVEALARRTTRLLTITGTPGTGKTRLALEAARRAASGFPDGVFFVDLATLRKPAHVMAGIANALHAEEVRGQARSSFDVVREFLHARRVLLLLDNFEHLLDAADSVARLMAECPLVTILATSREALRLQAENVYLLPPMRIPSPSERADELAKNEAVRLFVDRARASRQDFSLSDENAGAVAQICRHLDGLPLAIELAAGRTGFLPPEKLLSLLASQGPRLLSGGSRDMPTRHQALWRAIQWSHELLVPAEKALLRRLAVFRGGFALEGAEVVCRMRAEEDVLGCLESLVEKNLVNRTALEGDPRYSLLETIRQFAEERLEESGESDAVGMKHARFCLQLAESAEAELDQSAGPLWIGRIEKEYGNIRAAMAWLLDHDIEICLRISSALERFCDTQGRWRDEYEWLEGALDRSRAVTDARLDRWRAKALSALCNTTLTSWSAASSVAAGTESVALWRKTGDERGLGQALMRLALAHSYEARHPALILQLLEEGAALQRKVDDGMGLAHTMFWLAYFTFVSGDYRKAKALAAEGRAAAREAGDVIRCAGSDGLLGVIALEEGEFALARSFTEKSIALYRETKDTWGLYIAVASLAGVAFLQGDYELAHSCYIELSDRTLGRFGYVQLIVTMGTGFVLLRENLLERSALSFREAMNAVRGQGSRWARQYLSACIAGIAGVAAAQNRPREAARLLGGIESVVRTPYARLAWGFDFSSTPTLLTKEIERLTSEVCAALGDRAADLLAEGRSLSLEQLVEIAMAPGR